MAISLNPEQELMVGQAIQAGLIANEDEIVDMAIEAIRQQLQSRERHIRQTEIEAAADRLMKFGEKHRLSLNGIAIKDLINEGRR